MSNAKMMCIINRVIFCLLGFYFLSPIITPFFLGTLLAYLGNPFVSYLKSKHVPRIIGAVFVFLLVVFLLATVVFLVFPIVQEQILLAMQRIPAMLLWIQESLLPWMSAHTQVNDYLNIATIKKELAQNSQKVGNVAAIILKTARHSTLAVMAFLMNLILVPVVAIYLMRDWPKLLQNTQHLFPVDVRDNVVSIARECDEIVGSFFKGQLLVMLGLAVIYSTGLWLIGLQMGLVVGLICGCLAIVPYLGLTVGLIVASLAMYFETHAMTHVFYVWGVFAVAQLSESMVLTPWLVGDRIGLHPVAVIFSILAGGLLFGFLGILLALPVAAIILVILKRIISNRVNCHAAGA